MGHTFDGTSWLFRHVSLRLEEGAVYALVGPSGAGKSTLLSIIATWLTPSEGAVELISMERTSWVFQNPHGSPRRTALDHVALPLLARGMAPERADARAFNLLGRFNLESVAFRPFARLSGGEAQRLMLARAFASEPSLLLVDEPTAQLDRKTAASVNEVIASTAQRNTAVVVATHDPVTKEMCTDTIDLGDWADSDRMPVS